MATTSIPAGVSPHAAPRAGDRHALALALMTVSGFAGLGYQVVWTQQSALAVGHESAALLAVIAAFFGGLSAGALLLGKRIERSLRPRHWYIACELTIAAWSALLLVAMEPVCGLIQVLTGGQPSAVRQWSVAFVGTFLLLLPATAAMGATLPAMERLAAGLRAEGRSVSGLYAANTLGAFIGVLACAFWLIPSLGLARTAAVCVGFNLLCAAVALGALPAMVEAASTPDAAEGDGPLLRLLFATGLLGIGYEVLVVRVLSQVTEDTVYTFALLLAVYLAGTAVGATLHRRSRDHRPADRTERRLLLVVACCCLAGLLSLWAADGLRVATNAALGGGVAAAVSAEAVLALVAFGPPTVAMGALFSQLGTVAANRRVSFGLALGVNTLGAALAPIVIGVALVGWLGLKGALLGVVAGYLFLALRKVGPVPAVGIPAVVAFAIGWASPPLAFVDVPEGGRILRYDEGRAAAVSVVEDADGVARLRIDNRQQEGSSATRRVDGRQALLPLLLHPAPKRVLLLGLGTGVTASVAAEEPGVEVDAVELLPEVIAATPLFAVAREGEPAPSRPRLISSDARRYVRVSEKSYDVIVADNFHPARSGAGSLYTVEHFAAVRRRLTAHGLFCQWLPLHQLDLESLASIVGSFVTAFPRATALLANNGLETPTIGLIGRLDDDGFDVDAVRERLAAMPAARRIDFALDDELAVLGSFIAGPASLARFAAGAEPNTDDRPSVAYRAPRLAYAAGSSPAERLVALLHRWSLVPDELLRPSASRDDPARLAAYWAARNRFIEVGRRVRPTVDPRAMLAQVREPLLAVLKISPDFRPAYDPLLAMARRLAADDPVAARVLLDEMARLQPRRPEALAAMHAIGPASGGPGLTTR